MRKYFVMSAGVLIALFAVGCSDGGGTMPGAQVHSSGMLPTHSGTPGGAYHLVKSTKRKNRSAKSLQPMRQVGLRGNVLYIADASNDLINVYRQGGGPGQAPIGQLTDLDEPTGMVVAPDGDLYVSNYDNNLVSVYHRGQTTPYESLNAVDTNAGGNDIAFGGGNLYVGNLGSIIQVFAGGATSPTSTLTDSNVNEIYSIAVDSTGDVFDTGYGSVGAVVDEFPAGSSTATTLPIALSSGCGGDGGLTVDAGGNLYVNDCGSGIVSEYAAPYTGSFVKQLLYGGTPAYGITITPAGSDAWLASRGAEAGLEYNLATTRLHDRTSSSGLSEPYGIAVNPPIGN
jgi:hypothetical protein